jgi:hypothetical protein
MLATGAALSMRAPAVTVRTNEITLLSLGQKYCKRLRLAADTKRFLAWFSMIEIIHERRPDIPAVRAFTTEMSDQFILDPAAPRNDVSAILRRSRLARAGRRDKAQLRHPAPHYTIGGAMYGDPQAFSDFRQVPCCRDCIPKLIIGPAALAAKVGMVEPEAVGVLAKCLRLRVGITKATGCRAPRKRFLYCGGQFFVGPRIRHGRPTSRTALPQRFEL